MDGVVPYYTQAGENFSDRLGEIHIGVVLFQSLDGLPGQVLPVKEAQDGGTAAAHGGTQSTCLEEGGLDGFDFPALMGGETTTLT